MRQINQFSMYSVDTTNFLNDGEMVVYRKMMNEKSKEIKEEFEHMIQSFTGVRQLRMDALKDKNIISSFESNFSRVMGIENNKVSLDIVTVRIYHYDILDQIIDGFKFADGSEFVFYTASAGQIRTKTLVFVRKDKYEQVEMTLKAGLTEKMINDKGGCNYNKYMAYMGLNSAASFVFDIDIDKAIVIPDFESLVTGKVDYINPDYKIDKGATKQILINHTDGCGMYLSSSDIDEAMQIRGPWFKGVLTPFPYDKFINDKKINPGGNRVVIDVWNTSHDLIKEDIKYIFTKSQFKMWSYYKDWQHYKDLYKQYNCKFAACQWEPEGNNQKLGYQYLQTIDMTPEELAILADKSLTKIKGIGHDKDITLNILCGEDGGKNYINKAIALYPEMLNDPYSKQLMRDVKGGLIKQGLYGKLSVEAKYAFVVPDFYAACEFWIKGDKNPKGLLKNGEVSCRLFKDNIELDCMRAPHLYREHSIQTNRRSNRLATWFKTNCVVTSVHSLISKELQFDCDGDILLLCSDKHFVSIAKRNMIGINPLYYELEKAKPLDLNSENRLAGLKSAFAKSIGTISNQIAICWNQDKPDLDVIAFLVFENNATIDYAKTLWMPTRPDHIKKRIRAAVTKEINTFDKDGNEIIKRVDKKVPHYFVYAKDKKETEVEPIGNGVVDRLYDMFSNIENKHETIGKVVDKMDYTKLMHNPSQDIVNEIIDIYVQFSNDQWKMRNDTKGSNKNSNIKHLINKLKDKLHVIEQDDIVITDILVKYLYEFKKGSKKRLMWEAFGHIIVNNIDNNMKDKAFDNGWKLCKCCGQRKKLQGKKETCDSCKKEQAKKRKHDFMERSSVATIR